jgi:F0F1-type ATP synthase assembly protein I
MPEPEDDPFKKVQHELRDVEGVPDEELEDRLKRATDGLRNMDLPEVPTEEEIAARLNIQKDRPATSLPPVPEWDYKRTSAPKAKGEKLDHKRLGYGITIGYVLVGPLIVGYFIGMYLDKQQGTGSHWQTWLTIAGMLVGFVGAIVIVMRSMQDDKLEK